MKQIHVKAKQQSRSPNSKLTESEIIFFEGDQNYTNIYFNNGEKRLSSYTLLRHEQRLHHFIRISRSYLINPEFILEYRLHSTFPHVVMKCGKEIRIPRRKVGEFKN